MTRSLCFTVDVDRDVNIPLPGTLEAGSVDRGMGTAPRYSSSAEGLKILTDLLDEMGVNATYFVEGRTLLNIGGGMLAGREVGIHGMDHEDFTGIFPPGEKERIINESCENLEDMLGIRPVCSRMPYMKIPPDVPEILKRAGIKYDSSEYQPLNERMIPYSLSGLTEIPVPRGIDAGGKKIFGYLWPMHEGKRKPSDYAYMASKMEEGIFVLATHAWHMTERIEGGVMSEDSISANSENLRKTIEHFIDLGYETETIPQASHRFARTS